jgi:purine-binding chemotaxis protein CheW
MWCDEMEMATGKKTGNPREVNLRSSQGSDEMYGKYLTFWADNQLFGIPIADVVQIVGVQTITKIPEFPDYAKGIINLRGSIIPVIDVRLRLHKEEIPYDERTCIIVTNIQESLIGLIVDSVNEVANIEDENISQPPKITKDTTNAYLTGITKLQDKVVLLLNSEKILKNEEVLEIIQD